MNAALSQRNLGKFPLAAVVPTPRRDFYGEALRRLCLLCPDRAFVGSVRGRGHVAIEGTYGIRRREAEIGPATMELLAQVMRNDQPIVQVWKSGWRVCLAVRNRQGRVGAVLFAECSIPLLTRTDLDELVEWSRTVGCASLQSSHRYGPLGQRQMAVLLRSLSTMVEAGVPLHRALFHLARNSSEGPIAALCTALSNDVQRGIPLSQAASRHPAIFSSIHVGMLQVGETTGRLTYVLNRLAAYDEKRLKMALKVRSALTYPAALLVLCFLGLLLAPPFLLERHFELIRELHLKTPWLTQALMDFSAAMRTPWPYVAFVIAFSLASDLLRRGMESAAFTESVLAVPHVGPLVKSLLTARFARTLALQLETAVPVTQALELAGSATGNPLMSRLGREAAQNLVDGHSLSHSLKRLEFFSPLFLSILRCGEETGDVARLTNWLAELSENELDRALEVLESMLEPLIVLFIGGVVGLMVVATMLPLSQALGAL